MMDSTIYKKIESYLMEIITQNASIPDYKLPSERTLSLAFHASRKPVRRAYDQLIQKGYVTNIHGRGYFISSNIQEDSSFYAATVSPSISLIMPSVRSQFSHDILAGAGDFCNAHQVELSIHISSNSAEKEVQLLRSVSVSGDKGIILFPVDQDYMQHDELQRLSYRKYPLVLIDRMVPNIHASFISSENHQAMVNAVEFLHKRNFANLVYVSPPSELASTTDARINGFTHGLLRYYKMATPKNLLILEGTPRQQKEDCIQYLKNYPNTEIIIVGSAQRFPVIIAAQELGLTIPQDLQLMLIDDELSSAERSSLKPYILQQNGYQMGYLAAESLYNQIYGDLRPITKLLPVSIIDSNATP